MAGWFPLFAAASTALTDRSIVNVGYPYGGNEYRFINQWQNSEQFGPGSTTWATGTPWNTIVGQEGYPVAKLLNTDGKYFGAGIAIPASWQYGEVGSGHYYVIDWDGNGELAFFLQEGSITYQAGPVTGPSGSISSANVTSSGSSGHFTTISSSFPNTHSRAIFNFTGPAQIIAIQIYATDPNNIGDFLKKLRFYRLDDINDLNAGKIYRSAYKQMLVDLCPGAIRFMDWGYGNAARMTRFSSRTLPNYASSTNSNGSGQDWVASPAYGVTTYTAGTGTTNKYSVAAATGTTGNPKTTPATTDPVHGELVTTRVDTGLARTGQRTVVSITNASQGIVETSAPHGYSAGDIVFHQIGLTGEVIGTIRSGALNVVEIDNSGGGLVTGMRVFGSTVPNGSTITSTTSASITLSASGTAVNNDAFHFQAMPKMHNVPLVVELGADSTHYKLKTLGGSNFDTTSFGVLSYNAASNFYVTLNAGGRGDWPISLHYGNAPIGGAGDGFLPANSYRTFIFDKTISLKSDGAGNQIFGVWMINEDGAHNGGIPLELCTALINELNAMSPAHPIHMYMCIPYLGHSSIDPDYDASENWGVQATNIILNGNTVGGVTYSGLVNPNWLFIEGSNETWNSNGGPAVTQTFYLAYRGYCRWGTTLSDFSSMSTFRSSIAMNDIKNSAYYNSGRVKFVLAGQGTQGATGINDARMDGTSYVLSDPDWIGGVPFDHHDVYAIAAYLEANGSFVSANRDTIVASWISHIGNDASQEADAHDYVAGIINSPEVNSGETIYRYQHKIVPDLAARCATYGDGKKSVILYECGWNEAIQTKAQSSFPETYINATIDGSTATITNMRSDVVANISAGDFVFGHGIPKNTYVVSKPGGGTSLVLSNNTTVAKTLGSVLVMAPTDAFLWATKNSQAWADAMVGFFDSFNSQSNAALPADYLTSGLRWGHIFPSSFGASSNTEWTEFTKAFIQSGNRNRGLNG